MFAKPLAACTFNSFRVIRCLSQSASPKNRYFYHILVSPGDAPGAIMLNVVWMEREFDAYKLYRSMYPPIFNSFPVIRTASAKKSPFSRTASFLPSSAPLIHFQRIFSKTMWMCWRRSSPNCLTGRCHRECFRRSSRQHTSLHY